MPTPYSVIIKEKSETETGAKLTVDIPAFNSKYPTILNRVPPNEAAGLTIGGTYVLLLERGNPMKNKDGTPLSPDKLDKLYNFWWNYKGIAPAGTEAESPSAVEKPTPQANGTRDATGRSIERQQALIQAMAWFGHVHQFTEDGTVTPTFEEILARADQMAAWLAHGQSATAKATEAPPAPSQRVTEAVPGAATIVAPPMFKDTGSVKMWAWNTHKLSNAQVLAIPGVDDALKRGAYDQAAALIAVHVTAKEA